VKDLPENREFFRSFKEQVKSRFQQSDVWMITYQIDVM
jgi:hypothetical protein